MATTRIVVTAQAFEGPYSNLLKTLSFQAADASLKNYTPLTGREFLVAWNTDGATPYTVTVSSVANPKGRTRDITAYSLAAGEKAVSPVFPLTGWQQTDGNLYFEANNAAVKFAVCRLPAHVN